MSCGQALGYTCSETPGCGEHFASLEAFDAHLVNYGEGSTYCRPVAALAATGWEQDERGLWRSPRALAKRERMRGLR